MKNIIAVIIITFSFQMAVYAQDICINDTTKYLVTYNYIVNDSVSSINIDVSPFIVDLDFLWNRENLMGYPDEQKILDELIKYQWFDDFYSPTISKIFNSINKESQSIVFFSLVERNVLRADLIINKGIDNEFRFDYIARFNTNPIYSYLFFFDENDSIKLVLRQEMIYE